MGAKPMPRSVLYVSAAVIVLCLVVATLKVTTAGPTSPPCEHCGAGNAIASVKHDDSTVYTCRQCKMTFRGTTREDFSWVDAVLHWLDE